MSLAGGILASPFLDLRYAGFALPLACLLALVRRKLGLLAVGLVGAVLATAPGSGGPPVVADDGLPHRVTARLITPPTSQGDGVYFIAEILVVDRVPIRSAPVARKMCWHSKAIPIARNQL